MARDSHITDIFLLPGDYFVGGAGHRVRTLLGSCVSITLWHPEKKVGAMSHFLLSSRNQDKGCDNKSAGLNSRYGEDALQLMLSGLRSLGVEPKECQAKIFGGGQMFPGTMAGKSAGKLAGTSAGTSAGIGRQNGEVALRLLQVHGIPVLSESLYGVGHRNIIFDIGNGHVWSRHVVPGLAATPAAMPADSAAPTTGPSLRALCV